MNVGLRIVVGLGSVGLFVFCDYTITRWADRFGTEGFWTWRLLLTFITAPIAAICFGLVGTRMGLAAVSGLINTGIVVGGVIAGVLLRGDSLSTYQKVGLGFGLIAMLLLHFGKMEDAPAIP